jgi:hypothetical protein
MEMSWQTKQPNWVINSITARIMLLSILMLSAASATSQCLWERDWLRNVKETGKGRQLCAMDTCKIS